MKIPLTILLQIPAQSLSLPLLSHLLPIPMMTRRKTTVVRKKMMKISLSPNLNQHR